MTIWAPMFSQGSSSSISLATVTPSLVTVGEPKDFSSTTTRPVGPRVTFTARANCLTPRRMASRACASNVIFFFAIDCFSHQCSRRRPKPAPIAHRAGAKAAQLRIARMSLSSININSSPSTLISVPA